MMQRYKMFGIIDWIYKYSSRFIENFSNILGRGSTRHPIIGFLE